MIYEQRSNQAEDDLSGQRASEIQAKARGNKARQASMPAQAIYFQPAGVW